jgi:hypothetical protein
MKTAFMERITLPVKPGELLFALEVIEAAGTGDYTDPQAVAHRFVHGSVALREHIADQDKAASLNSRAWALSYMYSDPRIERWTKGNYRHHALLVAAAELPMTDNARFNPNDFFAELKKLSSVLRKNK